MAMGGVFTWALTNDRRTKLPMSREVNRPTKSETPSPLRRSMIDEWTSKFGAILVTRQRDAITQRQHGSTWDIM